MCSGLGICEGLMGCLMILGYVKDSAMVNGSWDIRGTVGCERDYEILGIVGCEGILGMCTGLEEWCCGQQCRR